MANDASKSVAFMLISERVYLSEENKEVWLVSRKRKKKKKSEETFNR